MARTKTLLYGMLLATSVAYGNTLPDTVDERSVSVIFDLTENLSSTVPDLIEERERLIGDCQHHYRQQRARGYVARIQDNLYEFMNDINRITARIQGRAVPVSPVSREEKLESLAEAQCRLYYKMGKLN